MMKIFALKAPRTLFAAMAFGFLLNAADVAPDARALNVTGAKAEDELTCLAMNVYWEARSEPLAGQFAVAAVTLNRARSSAFPPTVCGVIDQGSLNGRRKTCQFSWRCDDRSDEPTNPSAWALARGVAIQAMNGKMPDPTGGATHYHATYVEPEWANRLTRLARIGRHVFYQDPAARPETPAVDDPFSQPTTAEVAGLM